MVWNENTCLRFWKHFAYLKNIVANLQKYFLHCCKWSSCILESKLFTPLKTIFHARNKCFTPLKFYTFAESEICFCIVANMLKTRIALKTNNCFQIYIFCFLTTYILNRTNLFSEYWKHTIWIIEHSVEKKFICYFEKKRSARLEELFQYNVEHTHPKYRKHICLRRWQQKHRYFEIDFGISYNYWRI